MFCSVLIHSALLTLRKTAMAKEWLKCALSSDQRNFYNFVPPLVDNTYKLFVRYFWYIHVEDSNKANNLLREARQEWGMEPKYLYSRYHGHGEEVGGDSLFPAHLCFINSCH